MVQWQPDWVLWAFLFALGAAIGSFLNVVIYRLPRAESIAFPPSHCFSCGSRLTVLDGAARTAFDALLKGSGVL